MPIRTDIALEQALHRAPKDLPPGVTWRVTALEREQAELTDLCIQTSEAAEALGRPKGRYLTLKALDGTFDRFSEAAGPRAEYLARLIRELCPSHDRVLAAGLGNRSITPDSLGPLCADKLFATRHLRAYARELDLTGLGELAVISPGVLGSTGIEAEEQVKAIAGLVEPDLVTAVDALACCELGHLGRTVQLSTSGISPGSGVSNSRRELSRATLGVTCLSIGIPTVADLGSLYELENGTPAPEELKGLTVTPSPIDKLVRNGAELIAEALNLAFLPGLTAEEIRSLTQ